jgi:hypothetical protein
MNWQARAQWLAMMARVRDFSSSNMRMFIVTDAVAFDTLAPTQLGDARVSGL